MTYTWNSAFIATPDTDNGYPYLMGEYISQFKEAFQERWSIDHELDMSDPLPQGIHGKHKNGATRTYYTTSVPTTRPDGSTPLDSDDTGRLWYDTINDLLMCWNGSSWEGLFFYLKDSDYETDGTLEAETGVFDSISFDSYTFNYTSTYGTTSLTADQYWVIPKGIYYISILSSGNSGQCDVQMNYPGIGWLVSFTFNNPGGFSIVSDGTNYRVHGPTSSFLTLNLAYRKFGG